MYKNLEAEMARIGVSKIEMAKKIGMPYVTLVDKISGRSRFWYEEAVQIREEFFPDLSFEYLYEKKEKIQV
jgi:hypothetical protein